MLKLKNLILIVLFFLLISCELIQSEEQIITKENLIGTWRFVKFEYDSIEYLATDTNICTLIHQNLGDIWYINTGFSCEWGVASLSGKDIVKWQFHDNCSQRWHLPTVVNVYPDNTITVAAYTFKTVSYDGITLVVEIIRLGATQEFPLLPIGGVYTFHR